MYRLGWIRLLFTYYSEQFPEIYLNYAHHSRNYACIYFNVINNVVLANLYVTIIGRVKRAPHWGVQSRFRVIYICMSVCRYVCRMSN